MDLKILLIDDIKEIRDDYKSLLTDETFSDYKVKKIDTADFETGLQLLKEESYDLVILDLCKGDANASSEKKGEEVLDTIQKLAFVPVIFFTGLPNHVKGLISDIIKVCSKGDAYDGLKEQIEELLKTDYIKLKSQVIAITNETIRSFFWNFVQPNKKLMAKIEDEASLSYILLRRLATTLSKDRIKDFIQDDKISKDSSHPMEFYIFPPLPGEYETGEIVGSKKDKKVYVILTPSCDLVLRSNNTRKVEKILLIEAMQFSEFEDYKNFKELYAKTEKTDAEKKSMATAGGNLKSLMKNNKAGDRYFFLPMTPFLDASIIDFQQKKLVLYTELVNDFNRVARLDDPFAQSMVSSFTRYYNRIGFPDLDIDFTMNKLFPVINK